MQKGLTKLLQAIEKSDLPPEDKILCSRRIRRQNLKTALSCDSVWIITRRSIISDEVLDNWTCDARNGGTCLDELRRVLCAEERKPISQGKIDRKIARILYNEFETSDWDWLCKEDNKEYYHYLYCIGKSAAAEDHWFDKDTRPSISNWEDHYGKTEK